MKRVLLGLGSNKSYEEKSPLELLDCAKNELKKYLSNMTFSSVYKTKAMYVENQDDFYNMAAIGFVEDNKDPFEFLSQVNNIEAQFGRNREKEIRFGPRTLDIDIELFGDDVINDPKLQIPHIRLEERAFVLIPAIEILTDSADELVRAKYTKCLSKLAMEGKADGIERLGAGRNGRGITG